MLKVYFHMYLPREEERELARRVDFKEATALVGPRRAGKTTMAKRLLQIWIGLGKKGEYFDLEQIDAPRDAMQLKKAIEETPKDSLVVLDEVQEVKDWIKVVRDQIENKKRKLIITGSSASLLSKEIASSLAGRAIPFNIYPLSYRDAKLWKIRSLQKYLEVGGYPECVLRPDDAQILHKNYFELTVLRDVAARNSVREIKPLTDLALLILSEPGKKISSKKTAERIGITQPTFRSFMQAFNDAFLVLSVPPYHHSPRERLVADAKHYAYDVGLAKTISISNQEDLGRRYENLVAIELVRRGYSISYLQKEDYECDFIAQKTGEKTLAIQVYSGGKKLPEREIEGLKKGMKTAKAEGILLSFKEIKAEVEGFEIKSIEKWLLEKK